MFCTNCGKNLPDDAVFCDNCGTRMAASAPAQPPVENVASTQAPAYAPAAPAPVNPIIDNAIAAFKGFFSGNPIGAVEKASKSSGLEWLILVGFTAFFNMFLRALKFLHADTERGDFEAIELINGLLETFIFFFVASSAVLLLFKLAYNKDVAIQTIFNVTGIAMLPLGCAYLLNIIFGFVWSGLAATISSVALIAFALLLYIAIQKLSDVKPSVWSFVIVLVVLLLIMEGYSALWYKIAWDSKDVSSLFFSF